MLLGMVQGVTAYLDHFVNRSGGFYVSVLVDDEEQIQEVQRDAEMIYMSRVSLQRDVLIVARTS